MTVGPRVIGRPTGAPLRPVTTPAPTAIAVAAILRRRIHEAREDELRLFLPIGRHWKTSVLPAGKFAKRLLESEQGERKNRCCEKRPGRAQSHVLEDLNGSIPP